MLVMMEPLVYLLVTTTTTTLTSDYKIVQVQVQVQDLKILIFGKKATVIYVFLHGDGGSTYIFSSMYLVGSM